MTIKEQEIKRIVTWKSSLITKEGLNQYCELILKPVIHALRWSLCVIFIPLILLVYLLGLKREVNYYNVKSDKRGK